MTLRQFKKALASRLWELREERGLSQQQVADAGSITKQHYQRLEAGTANPTIDTLIKAAAGLGVSLPELLDFLAR